MPGLFPIIIEIMFAMKNMFWSHALVPGEIFWSVDRCSETRRLDDEIVNK